MLHPSPRILPFSRSNHPSNIMGNFPSAPRQRPQAAYALREGMEEEIRNLARSIRIEAENNTRLIQQKYERREQRYGAGARSRRHAGNLGCPVWGFREERLIHHLAGRDRSTSDDGMRGHRHFTAPEPGQFEPQDMGYPGYPQPRGRSGNRRGPPKGFHSRYTPGREEPGLDENDLENNYNARMGEQYPEFDRPGPIPPQQGGQQHSPGRR